MIQSVDIFIQKIENGKIIGRDITDNKVYTSEFYTDFDITTSKDKSKPQKFESNQVDQSTLLKMIENANVFEQREDKVSKRIEELTKKNPILSDLNKFVERIKEDKEEILEGEMSPKIKNDKIKEITGIEKVNSENFEEVYEKLKTLLVETTKQIEEEANDDYNFIPNSPIRFTGDLNKFQLKSNNAYLNANGELTKRPNFYSVGIRGDYYKKPYLMILNIKRVQKKDSDSFRYFYSVNGENLTGEKIYHLIKRDINTIKKLNSDMLLRFYKKESKLNEKDSEVIKNYEDTVKSFIKEVMEDKEMTSDKRKEVFGKYQDKIIAYLETIQERSLNEKWVEKFTEMYDIHLPIKNNYEFEKSLEDLIEKEMYLFNNIYKRMQNELVKLRMKTSDETHDQIANNLKVYIKKLYKEEFDKMTNFACYYQITGYKDTENEGHGFITLVPTASRQVQNFIGFTSNIQDTLNAKMNIFNVLKEYKTQLEED